MNKEYLYLFLTRQCCERGPSSPLNLGVMSYVCMFRHLGFVIFVCFCFLLMSFSPMGCTPVSAKLLSVQTNKRFIISSPTQSEKDTAVSETVSLPSSVYVPSVFLSIKIQAVDSL